MPYRLRRYPVRPAAAAAQDAQKNLERPSAQDIYEQVANNARQELGRSSVSLAISGLAGGIFMGLSALGNAIAIALLTTPGTVPSHTIFFVGTAGDNLVHFIDVPTLTDTQTINPGLVDPTGAPVPVQFLAAKPRPTT